MQTEKVMKAYELFDNAPRKRYEFRIDGLTPMIEYAKPADGVIVLTEESPVGTDRRAGVTAGRRICLLMDEFERSWK